MTAQLRSNVRNFLLPATIEQILTELQLSIERQYWQRSTYVLEVLKERLTEEEEELKKTIRRRKNLLS